MTSSSRRECVERSYANLGRGGGGRRGSRTRRGARAAQGAWCAVLAGAYRALAERELFCAEAIVVDAIELQARSVLRQRRRSIFSSIANTPLAELHTFSSSTTACGRPWHPLTPLPPRPTPSRISFVSSFSMSCRLCFCKSLALPSTKLPGCSPVLPPSCIRRRRLSC